MLELNFTPFPELQTSRLLLRKMTLADAGEILIMRRNEDVMKFIDRKRMDTLAEADEWIKIIIEALINNTGITWAISLRDAPERLIGSIGYWRIFNEHFRAEIGYMLNPDYWQKGIMKEALNLLIKFGFENMGLHSIEANINPGNIASEKLLISTGFSKEAYFKENYFYNGLFKDTIIYSMLKK